MKMLLPLCCLTLALTACSAAVRPDPRSRAPRVQALSPQMTEELGRRIWANECAGSVQGLVSWNEGEAFPSLGIGHFIWYPAGVHEAFDESFPKFVAYARTHRAMTGGPRPVPTYVQESQQVPAFFNGPAPWPNKAAFLADRSGRADAMRRWLAANVTLQTQFIIARSRAALPAMMRAAHNPQAVQQRYEALAATAKGMYCLVDYVNFKGEGLKPEERYNGCGWGLLQVLETMRPCDAANAPAEFSRAASAVLTRRVQNAPAARGEQRWLQGWLNRCATYR